MKTCLSFQLHHPANWLRRAIASSLAMLAVAAMAGKPPQLPHDGLALRDLDGRPFDASTMRGRVVLVDVWATWCEPCRLSMPFYAGLVRRFGPRGFMVVAVTVDKDLEKARAFVKERSLPFVVLHDPAGTIPKAISAEDMPTFVLLGRDGRALWMHGGFVASDRARIEARVREAVSAPAPADRPATP
jgi:thiol-disulfide isomerase/thioredoxin